MAISFVGSAEASAIDGGDVTLDLTGIAGLAQNDLVIVSYAIADDDNVDKNMAMITAGYTEVVDVFNSGDGVDSNLGVFYKFMGASPDADAVTDGAGGANAGVSAVCMAFRGVDLTIPMDVTATTATGINTFHPNPPSINFLDAGAWVVIGVCSSHTRGAAVSYTFPTGYTTNAIDISADDSNDATSGMGYRSNPADPEDPGVLTHSGTDSTIYSWCAVTMALRPAAAAAARPRKPHFVSNREAVQRW